MIGLAWESKHKPYLLSEDKEELQDYLYSMDWAIIVLVDQDISPVCYYCYLNDSQAAYAYQDPTIKNISKLYSKIK